jgi:type II secretory pathway component PulM
MNSPLTPVQRWWRTRRAREQDFLRIALVALCLLTLGVTWYWLNAERMRVRDALSLVEAQFKRMQDDVAEAQRLRGQTFAPPMQGKALADALSASLKGRNLDLTVTLLDADRLRVQGSAGFDEAVAWLAASQRDYRVRVVSFAATRQGSAIRIDAVLSPVRQ